MFDDFRDFTNCFNIVVMSLGFPLYIFTGPGLRITYCVSSLIDISSSGYLDALKKTKNIQIMIY